MQKLRSHEMNCYDWLNADVIIINVENDFAEAEYCHAYRLHDYVLAYHNCLPQSLTSQHSHGYYHLHRPI